MGRSLRACNSSTSSSSRPSATWTRTCLTSAAIIFATAGGVVLSISCVSELFDDSWLRGRRQHLANTLPDQHAGAVGAATTADSWTGGLYARRGMQEQEWEESWRNDDKSGESLVKQYPSFSEYALEGSQSGASLPVPVVKPAGRQPALSIPIITIIGVQKGGTTNLRGNLLTHPSVCGVPNEVHFFDQAPSDYPSVGQWEGDGLDEDIGIEAAGEILCEYAKACVEERTTWPVKRVQRAFRTGKVMLDSSPRYIFSPLAPYRIKMARPGAKFVVILRDPTDRYFSQLRMDMCRGQPREEFSSVKEMVTALYHPPGGAQGYLARAEVGYQPYTPLCRGENASASDLWKCYEALDLYNPLYRGLYADQLERWFRVFNRSQIMVIDWSEMFEDFTGVVTAVAKFAGLPEHSFKYDPSHEHKSDCSVRDHDIGNDFFAEGGRYDMMVEEEELFREWYRPHNDRLYKLLGRNVMWR